MNFLSPAALFLFGIAAPIIALYILKLRRRREPVSTLMFWEQILREKQTISLFYNSSICYLCSYSCCSSRCSSSRLLDRSLDS